MALDTENFNKELYDLLKVRGYQPIPLDSQNQRVPASQEAEVIEFSFKKDGKDYGKVWITVDNGDTIVIYYDEQQQKSPSSPTPGVDYDDSWTGLLKHLKQWAQRRQLSFDLANKDRLGDDMKQREYYRRKEKLGESADLNEAAAPFRKGDRIEVVKGEHAGELGTVLSVDKDFELVKVTLDKFPNGRASANYDMFKKVSKSQTMEEGKRMDDLGYEIKGNKKPWGLYRINKKTGKEKLVSKHHNRESADAAKWDQYGMGGYGAGVPDKWVVKKIPEKVAESYHPIGKKMSMNDAVPSVKIILQHSRSLEEGEQRYRNVAKIFLENTDGERFLAPTTRPGIAKVYARHIAEGGVPNDDKWNHLKNICEEYNKLGSFVRATKNKEFNESAQKLIENGVEYYQDLRKTLGKLSSHNGYHSYFEDWTPMLMEDELDESINELFVQEMIDPRIESAMPILAKLREKPTQAVEELSEWAEDIINEKLELEETVNEASGDIPYDHPDMVKGREIQSYLDKEATEKSKKSKKKDRSEFDDENVNEEQLNELSKDTVEKYMGAAGSEAIRAHHADRAFGRRGGGQHKKLYQKRERGLDNAAKKLGGQAKVPATEGVKEKIKGAVRRELAKDVPLAQSRKDYAWMQAGRASQDGDKRKANKYMAWHDKKYQMNEDGGNYSGMYEINDGHRYIVFDNTLDDPILTTDDLEEAKREAAEWAEHDDIHTAVMDQQSYDWNTIIEFNGYEDATNFLYPESDEEDDMYEGLDANQKKAGQLGPTEKVNKGGPRGKLVGESDDLDDITKLAGIKTK
jgi:hypothetical protein